MMVYNVDIMEKDFLEKQIDVFYKGIISSERKTITQQKYIHRLLSMAEIASYEKTDKPKRMFSGELWAGIRNIRYDQTLKEEQDLIKNEIRQYLNRR